MCDSIFKTGIRLINHCNKMVKIRFNISNSVKNIKKRKDKHLHCISKQTNRETNHPNPTLIRNNEYVLYKRLLIYMQRRFYVRLHLHPILESVKNNKIKRKLFNQDGKNLA